MKWTKLTRETGLIEWVCECGVGHPDMNSVDEMDRRYGAGSKGTWGIHGCCGCCDLLDFPGKKK